MTAEQRDLPQLVVHADWSSDRKKRWMTVAALESGVYRIEPPEPVGDVGSLIQGVRRRAGNRQVLLGFDFPIGVPEEYAKLAGISSFLAMLIELGEGRWARFYEIAESAAEISLHRPFYPRRPGGTSQSHLVRGLGVAHMNDLLRRCDRSHGDRGPSCSLFWTLGGKQVGRAAITGWRDMLAPALQSDWSEIGVWPFQGDLPVLMRNRSCVVVETYPAQACVQLGLAAPGRGWSKRNQRHRASQHVRLMQWVAKMPVRLSPSLEAALQDGFGLLSDGEDRFDATVGLFALVEVVLGHRPEGAPTDQTIRNVEGWICGQIDE